MSTILEEIKRTGFYCNSPEKWNENQRQELESLYDSKQIQTIKDCGIKFFNEEYFYVLFGNIDNVRVVEIGNGISKLEKSTTT